MNRDQIKADFESIQTSFPTQYQRLPNNETLGYRTAGSPTNPRKLLMEQMMKSFSGDSYCIAPCLRGHGYSSYKKIAQDMKVYAKDLEMLLKCLGVGECYVLAHAEGTVVAMFLALLCPEKVKGMMLISCLQHTGYRNYYNSYDVGRSYSSGKRLHSRPTLKGKYPSDLAPLIQEKLDLFETISKQQFLTQIKILRRQRNLFDLELAIKSYDLSKRFHEIRCPMKLVYGQKDPYMTLADGIEIKCASPAKVELVMMPRMGHFPVDARDIEDVVGHVVEFVEECDADAIWAEKFEKMRREVVRERRIVPLGYF